MKHVSGGYSSSAKLGDLAAIALAAPTAVQSTTTATTTTTTTTCHTTFFTKEMCPRRFSDCVSDALPELSTQPSISAQSSESSQDKKNSVVDVVASCVVVGGGDQQQQQQKRGGSLDSGMRGSGASMIRKSEEPEEEEEEHHLLHKQLLLQPQSDFIGGRGGFICGNSWNLSLVKSEPNPESKPEMKNYKVYCLDAAAD